MTGDFLKVTPASSFCTIITVCRIAWLAISSTREYTRRVVSKSLDWTDLRVLDPSRGVLNRQVEALKLLKDALGPDIPFTQDDL